MKQTIKRVLTAFTLCMGLCENALADAEWRDDISWTYIIVNGEARIGKGRYAAISTSTSGSITIPSILGGCPVTSVGSRAFDGCCSLSSVIIPSSVTSIGSYAFDHCLSLTSVTIPSSVTDIGEGAFADCSRLTSVTIPSSVTSIRKMTFYFCDALTSVTIPSSVTNIGQQAFCCCGSLTSVTIPSSVTRIESATFAMCGSLTSVTIPSSVTCIESSMFHRCSSLTSVTIPSNVTSIESSAFSDCSSLTSVTIPSGVHIISESVFSGCSGLKTVTIPSGVWRIGKEAFCGCSSLTSVTIPSRVTSIESAAFYNCANVSLFSFEGAPPGVSSDAFQNVKGGAIGVYMAAHKAKWQAVIDPATQMWHGLVMKEVAEPEFEFEYFEQTSHAYVKSYSGSAERVEIPSVVYVDANGRQLADETSAAKTYQVTGISNGAFARNKTMKSVVFPASIQTIGSEAFYGSESLEQVTIPETVTSIGESAFAWCPKLKRAEVLGALELSANCFAYDSALVTVVIGDKVMSLQREYKDSDGALGSPFLGCEKLREISVGNGITYILPYVFNGLKSLETIRFGAVIRDVYHHAFSGCENLTTIVGTLRPLSVGDSAFSGVPAYFGAQFDDCTTVGTAAFWNCRGFGGTGETHTLDLPKITSIGDGAFEGCVNMSAVQLGAKLKTIGANAFKDSGAQVVCFDGPPPSVGEGAFALSGEPQGVLRNWDSWQDWQSAIDINTGMWHGLHFSQVVGSAAYAAYTFRAIDDTVGTFDPKKVTAIVNMRLSGEGNTATYAEIQRCQLDPMGVCYVPTYMGGDYEVWFVYDDETWKCTIDYDRFSAPLERNREMTVYFRRGNPAWMVTVYLYADEKAMAPYAKLSLSSSADAGQDFPAPELSPVELSIGVLPTPPWPTPTWLYEFSGWRRRHYNVQSGKWETGDPIPATVYLGQSEIDQGNSLHLVATWKWDLGGGDDFKTWEEVQTEEYDKVVVKSAKIKDGETSEFSVTVEDEGVFSFLWKTSTESGRKFASVSALRNLSNVAVPTWDHAEFLVDGEVVATRDGESQWEKVTVNLSGGSPHTVTWRYAKDASGSAGEDCVWVSDIQLDAFPELVIKGHVLMGFRGTVPDGYELIIPDGVTAVAEGAFEGCKELKSVAFPMGVTEIGYDAFVGCSGLVSVTLPPSVTEIRDEAFCDCAKLGSVTIPSSVTKIGINAFGGTALLAGCPNGPVVVDDCLIAYKGWCAGALEIPSGVRLIADGVFDEWEKWEEWGAWNGLTSVKIPSSVVDIGRAAFCGCRGLTSVELPSSVRNIGQGAFGDCCNLASIEIPPSVTNIGRSAFSGCSALTSVTIPSSVICIDSFAFMDCTGLKSVTILSAVTGGWRDTFSVLGPLIFRAIPFLTIGYGVFSGCSGLISVAIPSHVIEIGENAFDGCSCLTSVYVGKGDAQRVEGLYQWPSNVEFIEKIDPPTVSGDANATVTGDAETGFVIKPSEGKTTVEVLIPQGVDAEKVTVEVSPKVTSVKPNGAKVKIVNGGADITEFLNVPAADGGGVIDLAKATVKEEIVREAMDVEKGAVIDLCSGSQGTASPTITTAPTRVGLFYQLCEGETLDGMKDGDSKVGDGQPWTPEIKVKGGKSAFYSIDVRKNKISFVDVIGRLVDK